MVGRISARSSGQPSKGRRRGNVFSVRVTDAERAAIARVRAAVGGPPADGPWMLWRALGGEPGDRAGTTVSSGVRATSSGTTASTRGGGIAYVLRCALERLSAHVAPDDLNREALAQADRALVRARRERVEGEAAAVVPELRSRVVAARRARVGDIAVVPGRGGAEVVPPPARRIILDLCAGSGAWSEPYARAGYDVRRVTLTKDGRGGDDVRTYAPSPGERARVWGILAAPPCTEFSIAKNGRPRDFVRGMETVAACMRIVLQCRPRWWALENPGSGLLAGYLGAPTDAFEPCEFGDPWTKLTALWGEFALPKRGPFVKARGGGPLCTECDPELRRASWCSRADHRARTPPGFARAFFEANP